MKMRKKLLFNETRAFNSTNASRCTLVIEQCFDQSGLNILSSLTCVIGVVINIVLLYAVYKEWKKRKTPDKVLVCNVAIANTVALVMSIPFRLTRFSHYQIPCGKTGFTLDKISLIICSLVSVTTLGIIGADRLEALTKFAHQRKLTVKRSIVASLLVWVCSSLSLKLPLLGIKMPLAISIWMIIGCAVTVTSLLIAARRIRKHRENIVQMFGPRQAQTEIRFTKTVIGLYICHTILMLPHQVFTYRFTFGRNMDPHFKCAQIWSATFSYFSFVLLPVVYFAMDLRMKRSILPILHPVTSTVNPKTSGTARDRTNIKHQQPPLCPDAKKAMDDQVR